jgi:hypothetical protein
VEEQQEDECKSNKLLGWLLENLASWASTQGQTKHWGYSCLNATVDGS